MMKKYDKLLKQFDADTETSNEINTLLLHLNDYCKNDWGHVGKVPDMSVSFPQCVPTQNIHGNMRRYDIELSDSRVLCGRVCASLITAKFKSFKGVVVARYFDNCLTVKCITFDNKRHVGIYLNNKCIGICINEEDIYEWKYCSDYSNGEVKIDKINKKILINSSLTLIF